MCDCDEIEGKGFWRQVEDAGARELVSSAMRAAREQREYSAAAHAAERATIVLGTGAGQPFKLKAEIHHRKRNEQLRLTKQLFAKFVESLREDQRKLLVEFLRRGGLGEMTTAAKESAILRMMEAGGAPEETREAMRHLEATLTELRGLSSLEAVTEYMQHHLDDLIEGRSGNPNPDGFCILILIISSIFAVFVLIAALICAFSFGLACSGILDQMLNQACGS